MSFKTNRNFITRIVINVLKPNSDKCKCYQKMLHSWDMKLITME